MSLQGQRVLLLEDEYADYQLIRRCFAKGEGDCELTWVESLADALAKLSTSDFDVVLTDLTLPDAVGLESVQKLRLVNPTIPIVVLTTLDDEDIERRALDGGVQDYLLKDQATSHTLERTIHHAILRQQSISQNEKLLAELRQSHDQLEQQQELLHRKNKRLKRLYKTAHRFVDNVSHEFRTPLTVIKDYISLIREGLAGDVNEQQQQMLDVAAVRADDLNNMVDDMLDVSRLESGLLGAWRRNCRLSDIVEQVIPALAQKASVRGITFLQDVSPDLPEVYCDADKIGRVIINLVTNAMKFCGDPGHVQLWAKVDRSQGEIVVGVTDNGAGIEDDQLQRIFKRFKQIKQNVKSSCKGFGLGLNIAKELVDLNLGQMRVESEVGEGSTFSFSVPLADPCEVMRRYTDLIHRRWNGASRVSLLRATIDPDIAEAEAEDADAFFNFLLRRHDLLFRVSTHQWLIVLPTPAIELDRYMARANKEHKKANRNRPYGPLPNFELTTCGTWRIEDEREALLEIFKQQIPCELKPVTA